MNCILGNNSTERLHQISSQDGYMTLDCIWEHLQVSMQNTWFCSRWVVPLQLEPVRFVQKKRVSVYPTVHQPNTTIAEHAQPVIQIAMDHARHQMYIQTVCNDMMTAQHVQEIEQMSEQYADRILPQIRLLAQCQLIQVIVDVRLDIQNMQTE